MSFPRPPASTPRLPTLPRPGGTPAGLSGGRSAVPPFWQEDSGGWREAGVQEQQERREGVAASLTLQPGLQPGAAGGAQPVPACTRVQRSCQRKLRPARRSANPAPSPFPGKEESLLPALLGRALRARTVRRGSPRAPCLSPCPWSPDCLRDQEHSVPKPCALGRGRSSSRSGRGVPSRAEAR